MDLWNMTTETLAQKAPIGTTGLTQWIKDNVITLLILAGAAVALFAGARGNIPKVFTIGAGIIGGLVILGMATGNNAEGLATGFFSLFKG